MDNVQKMELKSNQIKGSRLKYNIEKYLFGKPNGIFSFKVKT